jgi:hypothetical protein
MLRKWSKMKISMKILILEIIIGLILMKFYQTKIKLSKVINLKMLIVNFRNSLIIVLDKFVYLLTKNLINQ